jgi:hypothetical protein
VLAFLNFHPSHADLAQRLARVVADHATPVGSGTVARTKRIPVEQRAEAAVIAWMRHQTTGYDSMVVPRVKGQRREVRRMLARRSHELLHRYRRGEPVAGECPLLRAAVRWRRASIRFPGRCIGTAKAISWPTRWPCRRTRIPACSRQEETARIMKQCDPVAVVVPQ